MIAVTAVGTDLTIDGIGRCVPSTPLSLEEATARQAAICDDPRVELLESVFGPSFATPPSTQGIEDRAPYPFVVAEPHATMIDLPLTAASALRAAGIENREDLLIFAHSALPGTLDTATACHIQHLLDMPQAIPFSVSHCHAAAFLYAARIAADLMAVEAALDSALVACSDVWVEPLPRQFASFSPGGDAAAAVRLTRRGSGWPLHAVANGTVASLADPYEIDVSADPLAPWIDPLCDTINAALLAAGIGSEQIVRCLPQALNHDLTRRVAERLGLPIDCHVTSSGDRYGFLSTADTPIALAMLAETHSDLRVGEPLLLWSAGLGGSVAAAVVSVGEEPIPTAQKDINA